MDYPVSPTVLVHHVVQIPLEPLHKRATSSAVAEAMAGQASKSSLRLGEDVPASLHYAVASAATFAIFLAKKMAAGFFISTRHSERLFEEETSEFRREMNF